MIIRYLEQNSRMIPSSLSDSGYITLSPGINILEKDAWESVSVHHDVKRLINSEDLIVESEKDGPLSAALPSIKDLKPKHQVSIIEQTEDLDALNLWLKSLGNSEDVKSIKDVINSQIERLSTSVLA